VAPSRRPNERRQHRQPRRLPPRPRPRSVWRRARFHRQRRRLRAPLPRHVRSDRPIRCRTRSPRSAKRAHAIGTARFSSRSRAAVPAGASSRSPSARWKSGPGRACPGSAVSSSTAERPNVAAPGSRGIGRSVSTTPAAPFGAEGGSRLQKAPRGLPLRGRARVASGVVCVAS
jgi:hypothetical protein